MTKAALTGKTIKRLMRAHRVTIRDLAARMDITQKRVREVRAAGVEWSLASVRDWLQGIIGHDPGPISFATLRRIERDGDNLKGGA